MKSYRKITEPILDFYLDKLTYIVSNRKENIVKITKNEVIDRLRTTTNYIGEFQLSETIDNLKYNILIRRDKEEDSYSHFINIVELSLQLTNAKGAAGITIKRQIHLYPKDDFGNYDKLVNTMTLFAKSSTSDTLPVVSKSYHFPDKSDKVTQQLTEIAELLNDLFLLINSTIKDAKKEFDNLTEVLLIENIISEN